MPWAPPEWCAEPGASAPRASVTVRDARNGFKEHDISRAAFFVLCRGQQDSGGADQQASSWHAAVLRNESGECFVMDLSSAAGTFLDGQRLLPGKAHRWLHGTPVVLGAPPLEERVTLRLAAPVPPASASRQAKRAARDVSEGQCEAKRRCLDPPDDGASKQQRRGVAGTARPPQQVAPCKGGAGAPPTCVHKCPPQQVAPCKCDKCDGPHATAACPHFKKGREEHKDAWANYGRKHQLPMATAGSRLIVKSGRVWRQPGDGSCLFHSLCFGLNSGGQQGRLRAMQLRRELAEYLQRHPKAEISGNTLEEWVKWDANSTVQGYGRRMATGSGWGGGIEMAVCSLLKKVNVHVYERRRSGSFERISCFDCPEPTKRTINVIYQGGVHYDAFAPSK
ncbi:unnamed protein product [Prorocentrum cordatum]|uniref:Ubiquitin thioesterase OTU n=1 Tax=Prorocentrum cordatum TaxID=2364126 RepID=A0ABN9WVC0_9DINO|nr:unnamed protein product [Polarella glacialis]